MKLEQIKSKAAYWCDLLGVEDLWDVTVGIGDTGSLEGLCGKNTLIAEQQISRILIAHDETEETLVHEILHIIFDGYKSTEDWKYNPLHELAINKVAYALVHLEKAKKKKNGKQVTGKGATDTVKPARAKQPRKERHTTTSASASPAVRISKHAVPKRDALCSGGVWD